MGRDWGVNNCGMAKNEFRPSLSVTNEIIESMLRHHSVRSYSHKPVDDDTLDAVIAAAQSPSTWQNGNNWSLVVVRDEATRKALMDFTGRNPFIMDAPVFLVWCADMSRTAAAAQMHESDFLGPQYLDTILVPTVDATLAAQSAVVAAESLGLGICFVGGIRGRMADVCKLLNLPKYCFPVTGMALGWPAEDDKAGVKPRIPRSGQVFLDRYDEAASVNSLSEMDQNTLAYWESQGEERVSWTERAAQYWNNVDAIGGRVNTRTAIEAQGYELH